MVQSLFKLSIRKIIENPDKQKLTELERVGGIRNRFAHYGIQMSKDLLTKSTDDASFEILDHRKGELGVDFEGLHREFMDLAGGVERYLAQVCESIGGKLYTDDEMAVLGFQKKEINHISGRNASMSMSDEQKTKIYEHLKNAGVHSICTACNQEVTWKQADTATILGITEDTTPDLSRGIPLIPIICENCGYVRFFSAKSIGLFKDL
jgi:hypothetical protein